MRRSLALLLLLSASPAAAQSVVTSTAPDLVSISAFRDPGRGEGGEIDLDSLAGFALISEQRTIDLPAGESLLRFEGVAEGMVAVSAIVTGLPGGVVQKNRDAALLSPASLLDGSLGNRVHLRRTDRATGKVTEENAFIRSGPDGAVVLRTAAGYEALRCSGLPEMLLYDRVPKGLTAKPTLSVTTRSPAAQRVTVTLTYLSTGFDWASNYVARVAGDGKTLDLFAWLTVANSNGESFADADLSALAGTLNVEQDFDELVEAPPQPQLRLSCFPTGSGRNGIRPPPPPSPPPAPAAMAGYDIVVTAQRREASLMDSPMAITAFSTAQLEDMGDLKLYRVPMRVTVAANAQKQVALLVKDKVPFRTIHRLRTCPTCEPKNEGTQIVLRMENKEAGKLGVPLPSGQVAVFESALGEELLAGEGAMRDHAVGETVNLVIGESRQVLVTADNHHAPGKQGEDYRVTVTNANPFAVVLELGFAIDDMKVVDSRLRKLPRKDGLPTWIVTVPANDSRTLDYRAK
ncbi:hypothetical protein C3E99_14020 [Sphingopyxis sp. MG]|uniref:DUF4139 domain-containing protein n=1 Tax=Sphingopyxis granuli TaxID=267128 RepID=A0AA86GN09_9SPHN|nr:Uncharacterized protein SGRAN_3729 [Sphingopyxis granuli]APW74423.1 hypothetical protein BWD40_13415 [Sphingopyxis granuli]AVA16024.1 hypothetical protein C3E99_14020 [Sphingopyxis sp. MG]